MMESGATNGAANGGCGGLAAAPQAQLPSEDERDEDVDPFSNADREEEEETTKCTRCCSRKTGCCCRLIMAWPRVSALTFGVVLPLFALIAMSLFFGK